MRRTPASIGTIRLLHRSYERQRPRVSRLRGKGAVHRALIRLSQPYPVAPDPNALTICQPIGGCRRPRQQRSRSLPGARCRWAGAGAGGRVLFGGAEPWVRARGPAASDWVPGIRIVYHSFGAWTGWPARPDLADMGPSKAGTRRGRPRRGISLALAADFGKPESQKASVRWTIAS